MHAQAVGDALDEGRPVAGPCPLDRLAAGRVDRQHVVAVDLQAGEAVGERLLGDGARVGLLLERDRDRPLVVLDQEHQRHVPDAGEVHRLVEIALGRGPVAAVGHHHRVVAAVLGGVGEARPRGAAGSHRDADRQVALVGRGLAALEVAREEQQDASPWPARARAWRRSRGTTAPSSRCGAASQTLPIWEASWPLIGAKVPIRPWRCSRSMRSSRRRPSSIAR